ALGRCSPVGRVRGSTFGRARSGRGGGRGATGTAPAPEQGATAGGGDGVATRAERGRPERNAVGREEAPGLARTALWGSVGRASMPAEVSPIRLPLAQAAPADCPRRSRVAEDA